ncbi:MAG: bifunctional GTP diphosphokinase/guanosine-3',5'-bis pyrophosphate 3'-pyrophosphohydrolase [Gammaproteobacteria bacterium]
MGSQLLTKNNSLFEQLRVVLEAYLSPEQIELIHQAFCVAEKAHHGQKRSSGEDYITHPLAVAETLAKMRLDSQSIMAALLHDVIEDTSVDKKTILKEFGEQVAELVDGVSKLTQIHFETKAHAQAENFRKMLLAMVRDIRVILIKLADRLHNMHTLESLPPEKQRRIARETLEIYAPIANRLGMHQFYIEFEDLGFAKLYPLRYRILKTAVKKARGNRKAILHEIEDALKQRLTKHHIEFDEVKGREKHLYSIYKKMRDKHIPFNEIMDVYAFRIIVHTVDTCYRTLGVVHHLYKPIPERFKDYIAMPKVNSYQSLHTTLFGPYGVPIEIQIRTAGMNQIAESGIAAHWMYKSKNHSADQAQLRARQMLQSLLEMQEKSESSIDFIENVKVDLFPEEVYVFTPKGKILELPSHATIVDFAYAVHSDLGNTCIAAKINRRLAPLSTILSNGQTVEIITAPGARPNPAWLNFVVTSKARTNIRQYINNQRRNESIELGQQLLDRALNTLEIDKSTLSETQMQHVLHQLNYKSLSDLYEAIGFGHQVPINVARAISVLEGHGTIKQMHKEPLFIKGMQGLLVKFASCCRPIPGDDIIGIFNPGEGLVIHTTQCDKIVKLFSKPEKFIEVQWEAGISGDFKVDLFLEVVNQRGVLAQLANIFAATDANIEDIKINSPEGQYSQVCVTLTVKNRIHLAHIMRRVRTVKVVTRVSRHL